MQEVKIIENKDGKLYVALSGEIDFGKAEEFYTTVMGAYKTAPMGLYFDCAELEFIDSTTLGTFVKIFKTVNADGNTMTLVNLQPKIKKLFVICSLDTMITIA